MASNTPLIYNNWRLTFTTATRYWTETNVADGLNALCITIEVSFFYWLVATGLTHSRRWFSFRPS